MKKSKKKIAIGIIGALCITIITIVTIHLVKNLNKEKNKKPFDEIYWNMKKLYSDKNRTVDIINNDEYYTVNVYNEETGILLETIVIDAYTGKSKNKGIYKENKLVFNK